MKLHYPIIAVAFCPNIIIKNQDDIDLIENTIWGSSYLEWSLDV